MASAGQPSSRLATRLTFFVPGVGFGAWAPLIPFAKDRLAADEGVLGLLLLCLGAGSIIAMLLTTVLIARYGVRLIILVGGLSLAIILPCLTTASKLALGVALFALGASIGTISVAANIHAIEVERTAECPLMSSFHAQFSIGGLVGSAAMTALLSLQIEAFVSTVVCSGLIVIAIMLAWPRLVPTAQADQGPSFVLPRSIVLLLAAVVAIAFLIDGAMLDWAALLVVGAGLAPKAQGGLAYVLFSIAMTVGRLAGDAVVERAGDRATLMFGSLLALVGFGALLAAPVAVIAMIGLLLIGLGLSKCRPDSVPARRHAGSDARWSGDCRDHDGWLCRNSHWTGWYGVPGQVRGTAGRIWGPRRAHVPRRGLGAHRDGEHSRFKGRQAVGDRIGVDR